MGDEALPPNPYDHASPLSRLLFLWPGSIVSTGARRTLTEQDVPRVAVQDEASMLGERLITAWQAQDIGKRSLLGALLSSLFSDYSRAAVLLVIITFVRIFQAAFLGYLVKYFTDGSDGTAMTNGYFLSFMVVILGVAYNMLHHHQFFQMRRFGMHGMAAACVMIYQKVLNLPLQELSSTGELINMMSTDTEKFQLGGIYFNNIWHGPFDALMILIYGYMQVGVAFVAGFGVVVLLLPLQAMLSHRFAMLRTQVATITDQRVKMTNQAIAGIRQIKLSGWEWPFRSQIQRQRELEMIRVRQASSLKALNESVFFVSCAVVAFTTFATYWALGNHLTPQKVFTTLVLLNAVQLSAAKYFAYGMQAGAEAYASAKRVQRLLELREVTNPTRRLVSRTVGDNRTSDIMTLLAGENTSEREMVSIVPDVAKPREGKFVISFQDFSASWETDDRQPQDCALSHINLNVGRGELVVIVGAVGSSKTSLLLAILGELQANRSGSLTVAGSTAYASQEPWIQTCSIQENILFGKEYDEQKYAEVLKACALRRDLKALPAGDQTMIGDRGVNLSGGQRARVALARMMYTEADVYVMDDPLAAVDPAVGRQLFEQVICSGLRMRTRVLVTHQLQFLASQHVSKIVVLAGGRIVASGPYATLVSNGILNNQNFPDGPTRTPASRVASMDARVDFHANGQPLLGIIVAEDKQTGSISKQTYVDYMKHAGGLALCLAVVLLMVLAQVAVLFSSIWLADWSAASNSEQDKASFVHIYAILVAVAVVLAVGRSLAAFHLLLRAASNLHKALLTAVLRAQPEFFDSNPIGRILNRFSKDLAFLDDLLPMTWYDFIQCSLMVLGSIALVCVANPWTLCMIVPLTVYFFLLRRYFIKSSRDIKRIESILRSPVFSLLSETLHGLPVIRGFTGATEKFMTEFVRCVNNNTRGYFASIAVTRWLAFQLDAINSLVLVAATFVSVAVKEANAFDVDPALLGLSIVYIIQLAALFQWMVRQSVEVENQMVSAERILTYCRLPSEPALKSEPESKPPARWPQAGEINFRNVVLRYRPDDPAVLQNITIHVAGGQRVGIVGRTAAGKSSLISTLFRLVPLESGSICIDGVDISTVGLHELRKKMCIIPQTPFLFSGTLRQNLDPFQSHSDIEIWSALANIQMRETVASLPLGLQTDVSIGGSNFSVGQRQLLCLARAILQHCKILVMDEATANVDLETDNMIQHTVATKLENCTVLVVAHRLRTIIDADKVLVLSQGRILEEGPAHELLARYLGEPDIAVDDKTMDELHFKRLSVVELPFAHELGDDRICATDARSTQEQRLPMQSQLQAKGPPPASFASMVLETGPATAQTLRKLAFTHYKALYTIRPSLGGL